MFKKQCVILYVSGVVVIENIIRWAVQKYRVVLGTSNRMTRAKVLGVHDRRVHTHKKMFVVENSYRLKSRPLSQVWHVNPD